MKKPNGLASGIAACISGMVLAACGITVFGGIIHLLIIAGTALIFGHIFGQVFSKEGR